MAQAILNRILDDIEALEPEELRQVQHAVERRLVSQRPPEEERFLQELQARGLLREIKPPHARLSGERSIIQA